MAGVAERMSSYGDALFPDFGVAGVESRMSSIAVGMGFLRFRNARNTGFLPLAGVPRPRLCFWGLAELLA
jgi:hypothetical protein